MIALSVLTLVNLLNYLDRYVVSGIVPDLKAPPLGLSDSQIGLLTTAFMLVYMVAAPIFGALGDRGSRTPPDSPWAFSCWSIATARLGIRDQLRPFAGSSRDRRHRRGGIRIHRARAAGRLLLTRAARARPVGFQHGHSGRRGTGLHRRWPDEPSLQLARGVLPCAGAPGLLLAILVLRVKDPPRGLQDGPEGEGDTPPPASAGASPDQRRCTDLPAPWPTHRGGSGRHGHRYIRPTHRCPGTSPIATAYLGLLKRAPYMLVVLGYAAYTFALGGLAVWMPNFLERVHNIPAVQATTSFGAIVVVTGFLGTFLGGWLGDYWVKSSRQAYLWMSGVITLVAAPLTFVALTAASSSVYYPAIIAAELLLFMSTGPINSAIANMVSPTERASAFALSMFVIHLLGDVPSPTLIGWLSDLSSLGKAVLIVPVAVVISGIVWLISARVSAKASVSG